MKVTQAKWSAETPKLLRGSCESYDETIKTQVERGACQLYHLESVGVDLWLVVRFEEYVEGNELVVLCVGGIGMREVGKFLIDTARNLGFQSIRYHASNPAVHRLYCRYGFGGVEAERVYKVNVEVCNG
jgi:hypothetical protein